MTRYFLFGLLTACLCLPLFVIALPGAQTAFAAEGDGDDLLRIVGEPKILDAIWSDDGSKIVVSIHLQTTGQGGLVKSIDEYLLIDGRKYHCNHSDTFVTGSQRGDKAMHRIIELVFHPERDDIPLGRGEVHFVFKHDYNGQVVAFDQVISIRNPA